jgi:pyridoxine 5-phosphate synthase
MEVDVIPILAKDYKVVVPNLSHIYMGKEAFSFSEQVSILGDFFAEHFPDNKIAAVMPYVHAATVAHQIELGINAGHDLSLHNLKFFKQSLPHLDEVSIGHALISDALYYGIENTIQMYKRELNTL